MEACHSQGRDEDGAEILVRKPFYYHREAGLFWFRIFGRGLYFRDTRRHPLMFSERNGYRDFWLFSRLK